MKLTDETKINDTFEFNNVKYICIEKAPAGENLRQHNGTSHLFNAKRPNGKKCYMFATYKNGGSALLCSH